MNTRICIQSAATGLLVVLLCLCGCTSSSQGNAIEGRVNGSDYEGRTVYLRHTLTSEAYDSTTVKNGTFRFEVKDTVPQVSLLVLGLSAGDSFPVTLPVVTGQGTVKAVLGGVVLTSGTPLNDSLQDFLLAVDHFSDEMQQGGHDLQQVRNDFSRLLENSVLQNKDNVVGVYIFRSYRSRFTPEQEAAVLDKVSGWFKKQVETNN